VWRCQKIRSEGTVQSQIAWAYMRKADKGAYGAPPNNFMRAKREPRGPTVERRKGRQGAGERRGAA
jgi:hypothetical protein